MTSLSRRGRGLRHRHQGRRPEERQPAEGGRRGVVGWGGPAVIAGSDRVRAQGLAEIRHDHLHDLGLAGRQDVVGARRRLHGEALGPARRVDLDPQALIVGRILTDVLHDEAVGELVSGQLGRLRAERQQRGAGRRRGGVPPQILAMMTGSAETGALTMGPVS